MPRLTGLLEAGERRRFKDTERLLHVINRAQAEPKDAEQFIRAIDPDRGASQVARRDVGHDVPAVSDDTSTSFEDDEWWNG